MPYDLYSPLNRWTKRKTRERRQGRRPHPPPRRPCPSQSDGKAAPFPSRYLHPISQLMPGARSQPGSWRVWRYERKTRARRERLARGRRHVWTGPIVSVEVGQLLAWLSLPIHHHTLALQPVAGRTRPTPADGEDRTRGSTCRDCGGTQPGVCIAIGSPFRCW